MTALSSIHRSYFFHVFRRRPDSDEVGLACRSIGETGSPGSPSSVRLTKSTLKAFDGGPESSGRFLNNVAISPRELAGAEFNLLEKLFSAIQEISFPFPQGFHHRFVTLAYQSLPREAFVRYVENGVVRPTADFVTRVLDDLEKKASKADSRFKFYLISKLDEISRSKCYKQWMHPDVQRCLADSTVKAILADSESRHGSGEDDELDATVVESSRGSFPPLRAFMRTLASKEAAASNVPRSAVAAVRMPLLFVEQSALLGSGRGVMNDLNVSF